MSVLDTIRDQILQEDSLDHFLIQLNIDFTQTTSEEQIQLIEQQLLAIFYEKKIEIVTGLFLLPIEIVPSYLKNIFQQVNIIQMQQFLKSNAILNIRKEEENKWRIKNNVPILIGTFKKICSIEEDKINYRFTKQQIQLNENILKKFNISSSMPFAEFFKTLTLNQTPNNRLLASKGRRCKYRKRSKAKYLELIEKVKQELVDEKFDFLQFSELMVGNQVIVAKQVFVSLYNPEERVYNEPDLENQFIETLNNLKFNEREFKEQVYKQIFIKFGKVLQQEYSSWVNKTISRVYQRRQFYRTRVIQQSYNTKEYHERNQYYSWLTQLHNLFNQIKILQLSKSKRSQNGKEMDITFQTAVALLIMLESPKFMKMIQLFHNH